MKIETSYSPPPIPLRRFDWTAATDSYEPGDPIGYGATEAEARADLLTQVCGCTGHECGTLGRPCAALAS